MNVLSLRIHDIINKIILIAFLTFNVIFVFGQTTYTTSQTVVAPISGSVIIECWGAGGGGGGTNSGSGEQAGGGGGGGAYSRLTFPVTAGNNLVLTIGNGGAGGAWNMATGGTGGTTSVGAPFTISATGGAGGARSSGANAAGGTGGSSGIGFLYSGGTGRTSSVSGTSYGGGGGGSAGTSNNGNNAPAVPAGATAVAGGVGGGTGGNTSSTNMDGGIGPANGGGGGGAASYNTFKTGGVGGKGKIILTWVACSYPSSPSAITGSINPCLGTSQTYSVTSANATSFAWTFPAGWNITAGAGTSSVTVTVGVGVGSISVTPSNACGDAAAQNLPVTVCSVPVAASFTVDGTWTVPSCVTSVTVEAWGAGGGGGGVASRVNSGSTGSEACSAAGGGGGGGYAIRNYTVSPGQVYTIRVGVGGNGGIGNSTSSAASNGTAGGLSSFTGPATLVPGALTAFGGLAGGGAVILNGATGSHLGTNGSGGVGSGGANAIVTFTGGNGATGKHDGSCNDQSGGGGGGAGSLTNGGNANILVCYGSQTGGSGGASNGGIGGNGRQGSLCGMSGSCVDILNGNNGVTIGAGGGGALIHDHDWNNVWVLANGGNGARGEVRLSFNACLPIELVSFSGECTGRDKVFSWITASELNNQFYTVEQSKDGQNYSPAINVPGAGTTTETQYYSATLANTSDEFSYFRLKQTDNDGAFDFSDVIYVGCDEVITTDEIWLFPNPASTQITLNVGGSIEGDYQLTIVDIVGKEIRNDLVQLSKNTTLVIDVNHLSRGNYFLKLKSANGEKDQHAIRFSIAK